MEMDMRQLIADIAIKIIMGIVVIYIAPAINKLLTDMRKNEELKGAMTIADTVVKSIQQQYSGKDGEERKARAVQRFIKLASEKGMNFTESEINQYLEKAVFDMKAYQNQSTLVLETPVDITDEEIEEGSLADEMPYKSLY